MVSPGTIFSSKIMLVRMNSRRVTQDFSVGFSDSSMERPTGLLAFDPCRARVGSAKTADAIVSSWLFKICRAHLPSWTTKRV
ncbi:hypothetical protein TNCV_4713481 [Trichonephila clavipes]|nr:hypothetical protein TNCV_4713481 [Trichonephila clavipes]